MKTAARKPAKTIETMSYKELLEAMDRITKALPLAKAKAKKEVMAKMEAVAAKHDMSLSDLDVGTKLKKVRAARKPKTPRKARYRDRVSGQTWTGLGRKPVGYDHSRAEPVV